MSRWLLALLLLCTSYGYAQYYDDDYEDDYYGSPFTPPNNQNNGGGNPQSQKGGLGYQPRGVNDVVGPDLGAEGDSGRFIPSDQGQVKFKIVEGQFWEPKKKRRATR